MRDVETVLKPVIDAMSDRFPESRSELQRLCEIEIGLLTQQRLMPDAAVADAWPLFSGYPFARAWGVSDERTLRTARYALWPYNRWAAWEEMLDLYQDFDPRLRLFDVSDHQAPAVPQSPAIAANRLTHYEVLIREAPPFTMRPTPPAEPGPHRFQVGQADLTVILPERSARPQHPHDLNLAPAQRGAGLTFSRDDLEATAREMDERRSEDWVGRLRRTEFLTRSDRTYHADSTFSIERVQHLLGIVGAGKSTIRDIIAIHLARHRMRVTVIVGDVAEVLKLVELYNLHLAPDLGADAAAPVIGAFGREKHAERLHRRKASRGERNLLAHNDPGFRYLSTSCVINTLLPDDREPLAYGEAPCSALHAAAANGRRAGSAQWAIGRSACPYWSECPRHQGERALVDAYIWVTTPAGLVQAAVPRPQNAERARYLELACRRSDLVIVDEADRVQMQLDQMFAPAVSLVGSVGNQSLLDDLNTHRIRVLAAAGRRQLSDRDVANWTAAVNVVGTATDRLYTMLVGQPELRRWVQIGYFNSWTLQLRLIEGRYGNSDDDRAHLQRELTLRLDAFRANPLDSGSSLSQLTAELLHTGRPRQTRARLRTIMIDLFNLKPVLERKRQEFDARRPRKKTQSPADWLDETCRKFEFTLLLAVLERKLSLVNAMWPRVQAALNLDFNQMYRGPDDYRPIVPESPMGNVVGFQFVPNGPNSGRVQSGELRFFRCIGVGRELLRAIPRIAEVDSHPPTNVLLMSGSSWAGKSSRYHIPVPVGVILKPRPDPEASPEADASAGQRPGIDASEMRIEFVRDRGEALRISGQPEGRREEMLRRIARRLGESVNGEPSILERELATLPEERQRILLLVGSYAETTVVADELHQANIRWQQHRVMRLVPDYDDTVEIGFEDGDRHAGILRRGDVDNLAETPASVLVAPLLAVERGHNILNLDNQAAIGTAYFLVRPNPRPDDIILAVHAINDWIVRAIDSGEFDGWVRSKPGFGEAAREVRRLSRSKWYSVLARSLAWSRLGDDRDSITWDMLVLIWQVIGRLVRGNVAAKVVFVDAAFAPQLAELPAGRDTNETSLLHSMLHVLQPYFTDTSDKPMDERFIVDALYRPLWLALSGCVERTVERN
ncbi:hypothetical protein ACQP2P_42005 [Dactylosporangium sp. CA-139114]|uniref:pPIWI_RE_Z domain-containing protein n=1 Tax=Dactylosporangium sp. CA-139114 TaxID=3239931 RepID=UPI003D981A06